MARVTKEFLSGSTNGRPIAVAATGTPGTTIHVTGATAKDLLTLYAVNRLSGTPPADKILTIEFGGTTNADQIPSEIIAEAGITKICERFPLSGTLTVRAFSETANAINIVGWVDRYTA